jgi:hypothetical protein
MLKPTMRGRRRLRMLLSFLFGGVTLLAVVLVLIGYRLPYNPIWWLVLGSIVMVAFLTPLLLVPAIEWVMEGYAEEERKEGT